MRPVSGPILTASETRAAEDLAIAQGSSVDELMELAGARVAEAVWRFGGGQAVLVACGPGNNGGDGYVAARLLARQGLDVRVAALRDPRTPAAIAAREAWGGPVESLHQAAPAPMFVDCVFGTGLREALDDALRNMLARLVRSSRFALAVDVPTGVGTDSGEVLGAPHFQATIALGAFKPAHALFPAAGFCGQLLFGDIGLQTVSNLSWLSPPALRRPGPADHKYARGLIAVVQGEMPGASVLAARAAQRAGAGYVLLTGDRGDAPASVVRRPVDAVVSDARLNAAVIGPGLGREDGASRLVDRVLATPVPVVIDADALACLDLSRIADRRPRAILTPHEGEFRRLFGDLGGSKVDRARAASAACGQIVVLKGADTIIAAPDGRACVSRPASHWLASAGTGDVLAGICGTMAAQNADLFEAACAAVWLHGEAARMAGPALVADDLPLVLPQALARAR